MSVKSETTDLYLLGLAWSPDITDSLDLLNKMCLMTLDRSPSAIISCSLKAFPQINKTNNLHGHNTVCPVESAQGK